MKAHRIRTSRKRAWLVLAALLAMGAAVTLTSCLRSKESLVDDSILTDTPCAAPCWQGIVPGESSRLEALEVLDDSPYVRQDSLRQAGTGESGGATWWWRVSGRHLQPSIKWTDDVVQEITLGLTYDLSIEQVLDKYGPPEAIHVSKGGTPEHWYWIADLYYPQAGVQFKAYLAEFSNSLAPSVEVGVVHLFAPTTLERRVIDTYGSGEGTVTERIVSHVLSTMRPWREYGDLFEVYYTSPQDLELRGSPD